MSINNGEFLHMESVLTALDCSEVERVIAGMARIGYDAALAEEADVDEFDYPLVSVTPFRVLDAMNQVARQVATTMALNHVSQCRVWRRLMRIGYLVQNAFEEMLCFECPEQFAALVDKHAGREHLAKELVALADMASDVRLPEICEALVARDVLMSEFEDFVMHVDEDIPF